MKKSFWFFVAIIIIVVFAAPVSAISDSQKNNIVENCESIKDTLKTIQHQDSRTRVYLGRYYETILSKYITPLNVRLVENNILNNDLIENQDSFSKMRNSFIIDFIEYQRRLDELVAMDCKSSPESFYNKLVKVRERRKVVESDTSVMKELMKSQLTLVKELKGKL
jgi:hypothetical protein